MKKRVICIVLAVVLAAALLGRIIYVNVTAPKDIVENYKMGETVDIGANFFYNDDFVLDGYSVKVNKVTLMTTEQYAQKHGLNLADDTEGDVTHEYVIELEADFTNEDSDSYFSCLDMTLYTDISACAPEMGLWRLKYPNEGHFATFDVDKNATKTMYIPYCINGQEKIPFFNAYKYLKNSSYKLCICRYPVQKYIEVTVDNIVPE